MDEEPFEIAVCQDMLLFDSDYEHQHDNVRILWTLINIVPGQHKIKMGSRRNRPEMGLQAYFSSYAKPSHLFVEQTELLAVLVRSHR